MWVHDVDRAGKSIILDVSGLIFILLPKNLKVASIDILFLKTYKASRVRSDWMEDRIFFDFLNEGKTLLIILPIKQERLRNRALSVSLSI